MPSTCTEAILFDPDPTVYLPHRHPFLFLDRVLALEHGVAATGELSLATGGYYPPLLLVEAMAQLGGIAGGQRPGEGGTLAALERVELPASIGAGGRYVVHSRVLRRFGRLIQLEGEVLEDGKVIAKAILTLAIEMGL